MDPLLHPYHHYLFFALNSQFYQQTSARQKQAKDALRKWLESPGVIVNGYATRGFDAKSDFMVWTQAKDPEIVPTLLGGLYRTSLGPYLTLTHTRFGMIRPSPYSGRTGKKEQVIQYHDNRLKYFIVYPFSKTIDWHQKDFDARRKLMGGHVKVGLGYPDIRQCLLYSYGVDDDEFIVSYETDSLERFQDLVMELRGTEVRKYTLRDTPIFTGLYKTTQELVDWL